MHKLFFLFLFSFSLFAKDFTVATYNVENLFDLNYDKTEYREFIPNKTNWNNTILNIKLDNISKVINDLNTDIIALQEVESKIALSLLAKKMPQYPYYAFIKNPNSTVGVGILSKFKIIQNKAIKIKTSSKIERDIQKVIIEIQKDKQLTIFNNHWRSKRAKESKRIEYALSLQNYLKTLPKDSDYILLGDFNSNYDEYLTFKNDKKLNDSYGITGINQVLNTTINQEYVTKENLQNYSQKVNYNLWLELPYHKRFSYFFKNNPNTPDNIIISPALFDNKNISYVNNSFKVLTSLYLINGKKINRWQMNKDFHKGKGYSDHLPIIATFSTKLFNKEFKKVSNTKNNFDFIYEIDTLNEEVEIKNVLVLYKTNNSAILKTKNARSIFAFNCASNLEVGNSYDIEISKIKTHYGLKEVTQLEVLKKHKEKFEPQNFYVNAQNINLHDLKYQNEIITNLTGIYEDDYLHFGQNKIRIYSKNKTLLPKNGQKITIISGHLGFFKSNAQIIIYKKSDYSVN